MSISPGSDIVMDVMRAADPQLARQAAARLHGAASAAAGAVAAQGLSEAKAAGAAWKTAMKTAQAVPPAPRAGAQAPVAGTTAGTAPSAAPGAEAGRTRGAPLRLTPADAPVAGLSSVAARGADAGQARRLADAHARLEGVLVESMLNGMMQASGGSIFGSGLAAEYWKSMLAQAVAMQVAQRGGLGLAAALDGGAQGGAAAAAGAFVGKGALSGGRGDAAVQMAPGLARQFERGFLSTLGMTRRK